jgi:hypothetical protein
MATQIYSIDYVSTIDGTKIEIIPLKIKYMRQAMDIFNTIGDDMNEEQIIDVLCDCARITMKQYAPDFSNTLNDILDNFDISTVYEILDLSMGIKINKKNEDSLKDQAEDSQNESSWDTLDLAKLETELFLLGVWKSYDELESSISMAELITTIAGKRDLDYEEKKFLAAIQGVELDGDNKQDGQKAWEDMKARVFSGGATSDSKDILALQGQNAVKAGFGIGMGLDYEDLRK